MFLGINPAALAITNDPKGVDEFLRELGEIDPARKLLHEAFFVHSVGNSGLARKKLQEVCVLQPRSLDALVNLALVDYGRGNYAGLRDSVMRATGRSFETWSPDVIDKLISFVPAIFYGTQDHRLALSVMRLAEGIALKQGRVHEAIAGWIALLEWHENSDIPAAERALAPFRQSGNSLLINLDPGRLEYRLLSVQAIERGGDKWRADQMAYYAAKEFGVPVESRGTPAREPARVALLGTPDHSGFSWLARVLMEVGLLVDRPARPALRFVGMTTRGEIHEYPGGAYDWHAPALFRGQFCFDPHVLLYHIQRHVPPAYAVGKKAVFMVRDPRDQMLSKYHWYGLSKTPISIAEFCSYRTDPLVRYLERIAEYPDKAVIHFEDYKQDARALLNKILDYLEFNSPSTAERDAALHWSSTATMGKWEDIAQQLGRVTESFDVGRRLIRDGSSGQHEKVVEAKEALELVRERCAPAMKALEPFSLRI